MERGNYRVSIIEFPAHWEPVTLDDSPDDLRCVEDIGRHETIESALSQVVEFNREATEVGSPRWAVVFEAPSRGRANFRVCTPLTYRLVHIQWPEGWTPSSPLDVPDSAWHNQSDATVEYGFDEAVDAVRSMNEAHMLEPACQRWTLLVAIECEPLYTSTYCDHLGTETSMSVRRLHVVKPTNGSAISFRRFTTVRTVN